MENAYSARLWFGFGLAVGAAASALLTWALIYCRAHGNRSKEEADERRKGFFGANIPASLPASVDRTRGLHYNSRGMVMASQQLFPRDGPVRAVVGICHGFGDHCNEALVDLAVKLVSEGCAVLMMDVEGHGLSDGLHGCVHDLQLVAIDLADYFSDQLSSNANLRGKPFFIYGVSMGGALAFNIATIPDCKALQRVLHGVILCAPMVKVSDDLKPADVVVSALTAAAEFIPLAPITPIPDVLDRCFKDPTALKRARESLLGFSSQPRLRTALAMLHATNDISSRMPQLSHPLLILHGGDDVVTCPKLSAALYDKCSSDDKTLRIYPGCWHDLFAGESPEQTAVIYGDMIAWIRERWS